jgi:hypothetical protein
VRVFLIADAVHDVSLFELRHVVTIQASQQAMATPLPPEVADREYDNRGWGVNIGPRRTSSRSPRAASPAGVLGGPSGPWPASPAPPSGPARRAGTAPPSPWKPLSCRSASTRRRSWCWCWCWEGGAGEHLVLTTSSRPLSALMKTSG